MIHFSSTTVVDKGYKIQLQFQILMPKRKAQQIY